MVFWKRKAVNLGDQNVSELTILEWKPLFSIKLFHFHETTGGQDRFHTHSFKAVSFLLKGNYIEEIIRDGKIHRFDRNRSRVLYIPDHEYHRITRSNGCRTLLITGPWSAEWKELRELGGNQYQEVVQGFGRVDLRTGDVITIENAS